MSCFYHLVIIWSKYTLNSVGERGQPWHTPLLISNCNSFMFVVFHGRRKWGDFIRRLWGLWSVRILQREHGISLSLRN